MKQFAVAYLSFLDNEIFLEVVDAENKVDACWQHPQLNKEDWDMEGSTPEDYDDLLDMFACADIAVEVVEVPK